MTSMHVRHHYLFKTEWNLKTMKMSSSPKTFTVKLSKMLRNKGVVYLSFRLSKSDVKAHDILYPESLVFCINNVQKCVFMELLFCVHRLGC